MAFPVAVEITLLGDGARQKVAPIHRDGENAYLRRVKLANRKAIERAMAMTPEMLDAAIGDAMDNVHATAGAGGRRSWPVSREFTGAKKKRFRKKPGQPHSIDEFYYDTRKTKAGIFGAVKNRTAWARAVERGAYYPQPGKTKSTFPLTFRAKKPDKGAWRRKPLGALRRIFNDSLRGRTNTERYKRMFAKAVQRSLDKEMREQARRAKWQKANPN